MAPRTNREILAYSLARRVNRHKSSMHNKVKRSLKTEVARSIKILFSHNSKKIMNTNSQFPRQGLKSLVILMKAAHQS